MLGQLPLVVIATVITIISGDIQSDIKEQAEKATTIDVLFS